MNEKSNDGSIVPIRPNLKGKMLDAHLNSPQANTTRKKKTQLELLITEEELFVWNMLADGRTQASIAKEMGVAPGTVMTRINSALERTRVWMGKEAELWRNAQLLIMEKQISNIIDDTMTQPKRALNSEGEPAYNRNGVPVWEVNETQAGKARNMARITLKQYLEHQAKLLNLTVERKEVVIDQKVAIGVYAFGDGDGAASMDDL